jgi:DNA-binding GntR family transcriptional regulator
LDFGFAPIKFDNTYNIRDSVYSILRSAILDGRLQAGQHLVERDIAGQLKVSRTPVREAIQKLENEKLVTHIPRRGVFVAGFTKEDAEEIGVIRIALESLCCSIAATKITADELADLQAINHKMLEEHKNGNVAKAVALNKKFHESIYKAARSPHLYYFVSTLRDYITPFTKLSYQRSGRIEDVYEEHGEIIEKMQLRDGDGAYAAAKAHIEKSGEAYAQMAYF